MKSKMKYLAKFLVGVLPLAGLGYAIYYLISVNPVDSIIGKVFGGFLIIWFLYGLLSLPGEVKGLTMVLRAHDPETVIAAVAELRERRML